MADATDFKAGDVVRLKSGGPLMTVTEAPATEEVTHGFNAMGKFVRTRESVTGFVAVQYTGGDGCVHRTILPPVCLEHVQPFVGVLSQVPSVVRVVEGGG